MARQKVIEDIENLWGQLINGNQTDALSTKTDIESILSELETGVDKMINTYEQLKQEYYDIKGVEYCKEKAQTVGS